MPRDLDVAKFPLALSSHGNVHARTTHARIVAHTAGMKKISAMSAINTSSIIADQDHHHDRQECPFARKLNIVKSAANEQNANPEQEWLRKSIKETFGKLFAVNMERQIVAHGAFEPHEIGGVQFKRTVARGQLNRVNPHWSEDKFEKEFSAMQELQRELENILRHIKPYTPSLDFSDPRNSMYLVIL